MWEIALHAIWPFMLFLLYGFAVVVGLIAIVGGLIKIFYEERFKYWDKLNRNAIDMRRELYSLGQEVESSSVEKKGGKDGTVH